MADLKSLSVRLGVDVGGYLKGMGLAAAETKQLGKAIDQTSSKVDAGGQRMKASMKNVGQGLLVGGGAVLAGLAFAEHAAMGFEKELSGVQAVTQGTAASMEVLRQAALKAGKDTVFSASEAAQAEAELAKAGVSVSEILGGALSGSLSLAAAGQLDLAEAATISAQAMNIFKLGGDQVGHIADVLAAGANKSAADVGQLGAALRQGGLLAAQTGLSLEDTVGALSAFADNALIGSDAGTSLKTMLQRLTPQSAEAVAMMDQLGITAYDAQGKFVGLEKFAGNLQASMSGLNDESRNAAMGVIFGSDAVRAANILFEQGAAGVRDYVTAVNDNGAAARMAAVQMDNLSGDLEQLKGSFETALIGSGSKATGVLRGITQSATGLVNLFIDMPGPLQTATVAIAGVGGAVAVVGGAALIAVPKVLAFDASLKTLTGGAVGARGALLGLGKAGLSTAVLLGAGLGLSEYYSSLAKAAPGVQTLTGSLIDFNNTGRTTGALARTAGDGFEHIGKTIRDAGKSKWGILADQTVIQQARNNVEALDQALAGLVAQGNMDTAAKAFAEIQVNAAAAGVSNEQLAKTFPGYTEALAGAKNAATGAAGATDKLAGAQGGLESAAEQATKALKEQSDALRATYDPVFAMRKALKDHATAQAAATDAVKKHGRASAVAKDAQFALLESTVGLEGAALALKIGVEDGTISVGKAKSQLALWAQQGLLSRDAAKQLTAGIGDLIDRGKRLTDTPAVAHVKEKGSATVNSALAGVQSKLAVLDRMVATPRIKLAGLDVFLSDVASARQAAATVGRTAPAGSGLTGLLLPGGLGAPAKAPTRTGTKAAVPHGAAAASVVRSSVRSGSTGTAGLVRLHPADVAAIAGSGGNVTVQATTGASSRDIATDVGWELRQRSLR